MTGDRLIEGRTELNFKLHELHREPGLFIGTSVKYNPPEYLNQR